MKSRKFHPHLNKSVFRIYRLLVLLAAIHCLPASAMGTSYEWALGASGEPACLKVEGLFTKIIGPEKNNLLCDKNDSYFGFIIVSAINRLVCHKISVKRGIVFEDAIDASGKSCKGRAQAVEKNLLAEHISALEGSCHRKCGGNQLANHEMATREIDSFFLDNWNVLKEKFPRIIPARGAVSERNSFIEKTSNKLQKFNRISQQEALDVVGLALRHYHRDGAQEDLAQVRSERPHGTLVDLVQDNAFIQVRELLGEGSQKLIYLSTDVKGNEVVFAEDKQGPANSGSALESLLMSMIPENTANILKTMVSAPGHLVLKYYNKGDLFRQVVKGKLTPADHQEIMIHITRGVANLHRLGIIHRDLKLENILANHHDGSWDVAVSDMGLGYVVGGQDPLMVSMRAKFAGTMFYVSPDYVKSYTHVPPLVSDDINRANDIWGLGLIAFMMVTKKNPDWLTTKTNRDSEALLHIRNLTQQDVQRNIDANVPLNHPLRYFITRALQVDSRLASSAEELLRIL